MALYVHNLRSTAIGVREFVLIGSDAGTTWQNKRDWQVIDAKPASGPEHFVDYVEENLQVVAELTSSHIIWAGNPPLGFPWVTIGTGGRSKNGWQTKGVTLLDKSFSVNTRYVVPEFTAERLGDTDSHKQFLINLV